jgi:hypothetical protein
MLLVPPTLLVAALLALILGVRLVPVGRSGAFTRPELSAPWMPLAAGCIVAAIVTWIWGGLRAPPVIDDEAAYLLQAALFARARWTAPSPDIVGAFTQPAVLLTPALAPKMPPGHAILLVPGVLMGLPGLMPMVLLGCTAALLMLLARRFHGVGVATLAVSLWLTQGAQSRWRASYMSETTTAFLWLGGWWCLLRWRDSRRVAWLLALAAMTGWGAITRPLTMLMFALPVGVVVIRDVVRLRLWKQLALGLAVGVVPLLLLPLQNAAVTGNWRQSPLALYTRQYMPFDKFGFGLDSTPPELSLPPELQQGFAGIRARHREHVPAALPGILGRRLEIEGTTSFGAWRKFLVIPAVVGVVLLGASGWFALFTGLLLYLGYLGYAHELHWTIYYLEATPVVALAIALGLHQLLALAVGKKARSGVVDMLAALVIVLVALPELSHARRFREAGQQPYRAFASRVSALGNRGTLVFLRYGPDHDPGVSLLRNVADPQHAACITAYDLGGASNARVAAGFPDRSQYLWDEATQRLLPVD